MDEGCFLVKETRSMTAPFEFTPARLKTWSDMERRGVKLKDIAQELGCGVHTLIRYKRRTGKINPVKAKAGKAGMAVRYSREISP
jgi:hypothetical protein